MPAVFCDVTPLVPAGPDLGRALDFYKSRMGFTVTWRSATMAGIERGGVAFNLVENDSQEWANNASFSIGVIDLEGLYQEYRKLPAKVNPIAVQPWGRREFHLIVPDGPCFQFYDRRETR